MAIRPLRTALVSGATAIAALVLTAAPALAHVEPDPATVPAGEATTVALTIEHGCDDSPTTSVAIQVPDGLEAVSGVALPGWAIESSGGVVTWTADEPLPTDQEQAFALELTPAADQAGQTLLLKTVQTCEEGELRWIEEWDGEGEEPEHPAPTVEVVAAGETAVAAGDHHAEEGGSDHAETTDTTDTTEADHHAEDTATTEADHHEEAASTESSDDGGSDAGSVALVVLVIAAIGLGGVALVRHRRSAP